MPTSSLSARRRPRWRLRRVQTELPRRLPFEALSLGSVHELADLELVGGAPAVMSDPIRLERPDATASPVLREVPRALQGSALRGTPVVRASDEVVTLGQPRRWRCTIALGPGATVALDAVDARKVTRSLSAAPRGSKRAGEDGKRRSPKVEPQLSLAERLLLVLQPPLELLLESPGVLEWPGELYPYQREGVAALIDREALLLADDMGLGKTIQAIAALRALVHWRKARQALVVAPASLLTQWRRELEHWAPELRATVVRGSQRERQRLWRGRAHVFVVSYETLRQDAGAAFRGEPLETEWDVVVLDEAQKIKNPRTKASRYCKQLKRHRAWALTGTPLENEPGDLASILEFLVPLDVVERYFDGWIRIRDTKTVDRTRGGTRTVDSSLVSPSEYRHRLLSRHHEVQLRRKKEDVLDDLPDKSVYDLWLQLEGRQRETYDRAEQLGVIHLRGLGETITITHVLALIQRLKQICNVCPETGASVKLDDLRERLEQIAAEGQRALVFSQYVHDEFGVGGIVRRLDGLSPLAYHGGLSPREKDEVVSRFKESDRHKALVLSLRAGGQGLNLQEASYVIHFDRWWNPAVERQAEDRTHRLGQKNAVTVYRYICENTIEERIDQILRTKRHLFDKYVDKVSIDPGKLLGEKEIFGLFGLEPPPRGGGSRVEVLEG